MKQELVQNTTKVSSSRFPLDSVFKLLPFSSSQCSHDITGGGFALRPRDLVNFLKFHITITGIAGKDYASMQI